jgi:hypothetical protein
MVPLDVQLALTILQTESRSVHRRRGGRCLRPYSSLVAPDRVNGVLGQSVLQLI